MLPSVLKGEKRAEALKETAVTPPEFAAALNKYQIEPRE